MNVRPPLSGWKSSSPLISKEGLIGTPWTVTFVDVLPFDPDPEDTVGDGALGVERVLNCVHGQSTIRRGACPGAQMAASGQRRAGQEAANDHYHCDAHQKSVCSAH